MSSLKLLHSGGNGVIIAAPSSNPAANRTITLNDNYAGDGSFVTANSSGNVGIGTSSPSSKLSVEQSSSNVTADLHATGSGRGSQIKIHNDHGLAYIGQAGDTSGDVLVYNSSNSNILFYTNSTLRATFKDDGDIFFNTLDGSLWNNTDAGSGWSFLPTYGTVAQKTDRATGYANMYYNKSNTGSGNDERYISFNWNGNEYGTIKRNGSSTASNTSSDYRLKENVTAISDGITRLKTLKPSRFNFKVDKDTIVDGFLAHEVTAVPEAITGSKDAVATEDTGEIKKGDPIYQQIDQSKLVPLLTAALQEEVAKREALEARVAALEGA